MQIRKVLIANRGEIALRVARTLREMGIRSVAVFSTADRDELHVRAADEAYPIGPPAPSESYLKIDRIVETAKKAGCDAVHPGYGFLSENAAFAQAVEEAGLVFIGPPPSAIAAAGDKLNARVAMARAGVPVIPGSDKPAATAKEAEAAAAKAGFPVALKAVGGGGGKGIRVVRKREDLAAAFARASAEAAAAFGNGAMYVERFLEGPRHIEVQVLADAHGNAIHLGERECSIQRRHQKLLEECPSPFVDKDLRARMGAAAVLAARAVGYRNAGTVEFLVDRGGSFHFLEMNTRIQVEHPITELVYGVDLVRLQVEIAEGRPLALAQGDFFPRGHAIEIRLTAEDPAAGFLPQTGRVQALRFPQGPGVRVDSHLYPGQEISLFYDPMIGKIVVHGRDRADAIARMRRALVEMRLVGVKTCAPLLLALLDDARFRNGEVDTGFLERFVAEGTWQRLPELNGLPAELPAVIAAVLYAHGRQGAGRAVVPPASSGDWVAAGRREQMKWGGPGA
ncbi:MAG TPA: acetyl-CoA carboxylase biotin carboxylase subunit [Planctomycetota bacterium]|nr:acetyl-CoA carboxylase biotin carboxylase subunit [Planctomycetota bacterium]